ncbi:response regulator [Actinoplanes derwentensis]|uniref:Response regulator receiver domain-containing protein n=1 Tax=Actinoplanes derwentensis TaxID=113562 RepID=A0A1H2D731_9ACTN|nr:response regulator [Actinoplanes derwentensis]GID90344.1 response regulator [Actinoplanes derwentensis]SDT78357.1 Response regulator receiver domain-containing protein [Actinoplanes derwentensis]
MSDFPSVLVVEDSDVDMEAIVRVLRRSHPHVHVDRLADGGEAVSWLLKAARLPRVVLLDLNLVGKDGRDVLRGIRREAALAELPVVVLTSSTNPRDVEECYAAGATGYLFKSVDFALLQSTLTAGIEYWLRQPLSS